MLVATRNSWLKATARASEVPTDECLITARTAVTGNYAFQIPAAAHLLTFRTRMRISLTCEVCV